MYSCLSTTLNVLHIWLSGYYLSARFNPTDCHQHVIDQIWQVTVANTSQAFWTSIMPLPVKKWCCWWNCGGGAASQHHRHIAHCFVLITTQTRAHTHTITDRHARRETLVLWELLWNVQETVYSFVCVCMVYVLKPAQTQCKYSVQKQRLNQHESPSHPLCTKCSLLSDIFDLISKTHTHSGRYVGC